MKKDRNLFSLKEKFNEVENVGIIIKDIQVGKEGSGAVCFITIKNDKGLIEAQLALEDNKEFKKHIIALIERVLELSNKKK